MQYDRRITITTGNNRKSINWQPQTLMLSEFYEKLRIPSRSTETMSQYLNLKKSEQDEKKDIGGFVAGALAGPRRKAGNRTTGGGPGLRLLHLLHAQALAGEPPPADSSAV